MKVDKVIANVVASFTIDNLKISENLIKYSRDKLQINQKTLVKQKGFNINVK